MFLLADPAWAEDLGELSANLSRLSGLSGLSGLSEENKGVGSLYFGTRYNSNLLTEGLR
jgi:hypothetical protein